MQNDQKRITREGEALLRVEHLCQYFGRPGNEIRAVDDVSFQIYKGEVFGLVGESGCGKTTTGRSIIRLYDITSGSIYFNGIRISAGIRSYTDAIQQAKATYTEGIKKAPEKQQQYRAERKQALAENRAAIQRARYDHRHCEQVYQRKRCTEIRSEYETRLSQAAPGKRVALMAECTQALRRTKGTRLLTQLQMIFQDPVASLDPRMTVREIIAEGLIIQGERDRRVIDKKVYEMLELVGLAREYAGRYPHEFSGGQRQRIGVARALIMQPELIIADEPVSALDVSVQAQVINLLNTLRSQLGLTFLFIAHDLSVVKYFSDRIGVMYFGKLVELAGSDELFRHPLHPYTKSLLSAIPLPDPEYEKKRRRTIYDPRIAQDGSVGEPRFREILPGHFVLCSESEYQRYQEQRRREKEDK